MLNYTPASPTSTVCELLEKIIRGQMEKEMQNRHYLKGNMACQSEQWPTEEKWVGKCQKAFDSPSQSAGITHVGLRAGIKGGILRWIKEYQG